ncbi:MAG: DNA repair protein rad52 [Thelocarpon superellum]|nr:MAG: DNA repair protein rad52 [Thelocarpon superellum]
MPAPGHQHRESAAGANPFEVPGQRVSPWTAQQIATLTSRLDKLLGPEYISSRPGPGGKKISYLAGDQVIGLANEVFGFNGWSSSIQTVAIDFADANSSGKVSIGLSVTVRVTLRDGTFHEDIGYGSADNMPTKALAFEKAKKSGTTDALKRTLRQFGNVLGNCLNDKTYLDRVKKMKVQPAKWSEDKLHRHPNFAPVKKEPSFAPVKMEPDAEMGETGTSNHSSGGDPDDEFGGDEFDEVDFAESTMLDGAMLDDVVASAPAANGLGRNGTVGPQGNQGRPSMPSAPRTPVAAGPPARMGPPHNAIASNGQRSNGPMQTSTNHRPPPSNGPQAGQGSDASMPSPGFYTARAAPLVQASETAPPPNAPTFNPHAESPSIRKTSGIDHSKTKPVTRDVQAGVATVTTTTSVVRPTALTSGSHGPMGAGDQTRKVGMPNVSSPMLNRGNASSYKPPGPALGKRVLEGGIAQRAPLHEVPHEHVNVQSNNPANSHSGKTMETNGGGTEAKKPRLGGLT